MANDRIVLVRILNLERETAYFNADALGLHVGDRCVVDHSGLRLGVMLSELEAGDRIKLILNREPHPLYRVLERNGYAYEPTWYDDGHCEILIWEK